MKIGKFEIWKNNESVLPSSKKVELHKIWGHIGYVFYFNHRLNLKKIDKELKNIGE